MMGLILSISAMAQQQPPLQEQALPPFRVQPPVIILSQVTQPSLIAPPMVSSLEGWDKWLPAKAARLQVLDKVNGQATMLTVQVGQSAVFGSLTILVRSCMVRTPDQPADSAGYLNVTDSHSDVVGFAGWLLANEPSVSMMQHPVYDIRVTGCG